MCINQLLTFHKFCEDLESGDERGNMFMVDGG